MGWGSTFKTNIRYKGRIFKSVADINKEIKLVEKELNDDWTLLRRLVITNPADYVSANGDIRWNTYESTLDTIIGKFKVFKNRIIENTKKSMTLSLMADAIGFNSDYKEDEYRLHRYGKYNWFTQLSENLSFDDPNPKYGSEILAYVYFSRRSLYDVDMVESFAEDTRESIEKGFSRLEKYVISNPSDFITKGDENEDEDCEPIRNYSEVLYFLDSEFDGDKEWITDACYDLARAETVLNDKDTANAYVEEQRVKKQQFEEWQDKKEAVLDEVCKEFGTDRDHWFGSENWQKISEAHTERLKELGLLECPVEGYDDY